MESLRSRWATEPYDVLAAERLSIELGVSHVVATVLCRRGLATPEEARRFLAAEDRHDPFSMPGLRAGAERILSHVERGSRIVVYGDYDVDGVCATAMLVRALRSLGADPRWELPSRFDEGYGLSTAAVERLAAGGTELLITVDCGVTAVEQVAAARAAGLEVVVTDHHRPGEVLPECDVVHPALGGYGTSELCASGVVLKLSEGLRRLAGGDPGAVEEDLDLAALATVCDMVPLRDENRRIVRHGLEAMRRTDKPGLRALMAVSGLEPAETTERDLCFRLGPRLNAAGRMQRADASLELLLTDDRARADEVARELDLLNRDRQEAETRILFAADAACAQQAANAALVVAGEGWHPGVVGIVASRLVERWHRPCVVIALEGDAGRGSGRSISAYDLHAGLAASASHLVRFGGHRVAAGLELERERIPGFTADLARHAGTALSPRDLMAQERVDAVVPGGALDLSLAEDLDALRPFGAGNPQPTLLVPAARVEGVSAMGADRQHARFTVVTGASRSRAVVFGASARALSNAAGDGHQDLALRLEENRWKGIVEPRAVVRAVCSPRAGSLQEVRPGRSFWAQVGAELRAELEPWPPPWPSGARRLEDRRSEGFAGVVGDLLTSGASVLVAVADLARRRAGLEGLVAGLAPDALAVASWDDLVAEPRLAAPFEHVVALDPPPLGAELAQCLPARLEAARVHLCWTRSDLGFALNVWRAELDLRPALAELWRALMELERAEGAALEAALRGHGRHPRSARVCGRLLRVLVELALVEYEQTEERPGACRALETVRTDLERSEAYRAYRDRLGVIEQALAVRAAPPMPAAAPAG